MRRIWRVFGTIRFYYKLGLQLTQRDIQGGSIFVDWNNVSCSKSTIFQSRFVFKGIFTTQTSYIFISICQTWQFFRNWPTKNWPFTLAQKQDILVLSVPTFHWKGDRYFGFCWHLPLRGFSFLSLGRKNIFEHKFDWKILLLEPHTLFQSIRKTLYILWKTF